ncbi:MAG: pre-peptidase C-terminal domain-containing protein, partial [Phycisphaerales bacterium]|nr:pre-peptidase C-terminal domain-containing protein [Phycisphaerales bacterium]
MRSICASLFGVAIVFWCGNTVLAAPPDIQSEVEANDTIETATPIAFDISRCAIIDGSIGVAGDVDFFAFDAPAGSRIWVLVDTGGMIDPLATSLDSQLRLLDVDGVMTIEFDDDDGTGNGGDSSVETGLASSIANARLTAGGTYFLRLSEFGDNDVLNPYRLFVVITHALDDDEFRYNANDTAA